MGANEQSFKRGEIPKCGKQFSTEYQPDKEIWTEDIAISLFNDLIAWMNKKNTNFIYEEFLFDNPNLKDYGGEIYPQLISYLSDKFPSCSNLLKKAEKIQEIRLKKYALADKINAGMSKFLLSAHHGLKEKSDVTSNGQTIQQQQPITMEQAKELIDKINSEI